MPQSAKDVLKTIDEAADETRKAGHEQIDIDALKNYLSRLSEITNDEETQERKDAESRAIERQLINENNLAQYNAERQQELEMFRSVIVSGQGALKSSMFVNGGAAVALLAFLGNIWTEDALSSVAKSLSFSLVYFASGVLCAAIGSGGTYLSQFLYSESWIKTGATFHVLTIVVVIASYAGFAFGVYQVFIALSHHFLK